MIFYDSVLLFVQVTVYSDSPYTYTTSTANGDSDGDGDGDELLMYYILLFNPTRAFSS